MANDQGGALMFVFFSHRWHGCAQIFFGWFYMLIICRYNPPALIYSLNKGYRLAGVLFKEPYRTQQMAGWLSGVLGQEVKV